MLAASLLVFALLGIYAYKLNAEKAAMARKSQLLEEEVRDFGILKNYLLEQVKDLQRNYEELAAENASLQGYSDAVRRKLVERDAIIKALKAADSKEQESGSLKSRIDDLLKLKMALEIAIADLRAENERLKSLNRQLSTDLASARIENEALENLNHSIQEEMKQLSLANLRATAFQIEVEKRGPKLTANAKRARKIRVSFDLTDVEAPYRTIRPLYLVLTDGKGVPVKTSKPIIAKINVNGQEMDVQAVKEQKVSIEENQRLSFTHEIDKKLPSGYYRMAVYTDIGLLGASSFRLQ